MTLMTYSAPVKNAEELPAQRSFLQIFLTILFFSCENLLFFLLIHIVIY